MRVEAQEGAGATPEDHPDLALRLNSLGNRLGERDPRTGVMADLVERILHYRSTLRQLNSVASSHISSNRSVLEYHISRLD